MCRCHHETFTSKITVTYLFYQLRSCSLVQALPQNTHRWPLFCPLMYTIHTSLRGCKQHTCGHHCDAHYMSQRKCRCSQVKMLCHLLHCQSHQHISTKLASSTERAEKIHEPMLCRFLILLEPTSSLKGRDCCTAGMYGRVPHLVNSFRRCMLIEQTSACPLPFTEISYDTISAPLSPCQPRTPRPVQRVQLSGSIDFTVHSLIFLLQPYAILASPTTSPSFSILSAFPASPPPSSSP